MGRLTGGVLEEGLDEEGVLGESLHLGGNEVLQLQAPAKRVTGRVLCRWSSVLRLVYYLVLAPFLPS